MLIHRKDKFMIDSFANYCKSNKKNLFECYKKQSPWKQMFFEECLETMKKYNGKDLKIVSYNTYSFSCGFIGIVDGHLSYIHITREYIRYITNDDISEYAYRQGRKIK